MSVFCNLTTKLKNAQRFNREFIIVPKTALCLNSNYTLIIYLLKILLNLHVNLTLIVYLNFNFFKKLFCLFYFLLILIFNFESLSHLSFCVNEDLDQFNYELRAKLAQDLLARENVLINTNPNFLFCRTHAGTASNLTTALDQHAFTPQHIGRMQNEAVLNQMCAQHWESLKGGLTGGSAVAIGVLAVKISPSYSSAIVGGYAVNQFLGFVMPK